MLIENVKIYRDIDNVEVEIYADLYAVDNGMLPDYSDWYAEVEEVDFTDDGYSSDFKKKIESYIEINIDNIIREIEEN